VPLIAVVLFVLAGCGQSTSPSLVGGDTKGSTATWRPDLPTVSQVVRTDPRTTKAAALLDNKAYPILSYLDREHTRFHLILAPTNEAFDALPAAIVARLAVDPDPDDFIGAVIRMHFAEDTDVRLEELAGGTDIRASRTRLTYTSVDGVGHVDYATVVDSITAANGHVYLIDTVLIPPCTVDVGQNASPTHAPCETWYE
jgi:uncharacterized surface protein with fasciclin (FAS1) repeats